MTKKKKIICPKCNKEHKERDKQYCQHCLFNIAYWLSTGRSYAPENAKCLPFTKGY